MRKERAAITIGRISIGFKELRDPEPGHVTIASHLTAYMPILVDSKEVIALSLDDARRFAQALLHEVEER